MGPEKACWTRLAVSGSVDATTTAAGSPCAISRAKVGPESTAMRASSWLLHTSATTSDIRSSVPASMPLVAVTKMVPGSRRGIARRHKPRENMDGTTPMTISAPARAEARSVVISTASGSSSPGRYTSFSRVARIRAARSGSKTHSRMLSQRGAKTMASAVPQLPAPRMLRFTIFSRRKRSQSPPAAVRYWTRADTR